ncbi:hypothetical protein OR571_15720 [Psychrobacillus sp. NEAU-3TGS]|uniref:hypothetical protein n=1 Tax=Psychrobacillus sp. NEAU-3TGS TaxID=2995412 RepID=UPI002498165A|nr:hypothetical protein [Psychrobacillus sp. NEAU-3TGS]MDI2588522.1 hypothetical protein [Psychrobacillus sp. NEAU-3TGS]
MEFADFVFNFLQLFTLLAVLILLFAFLFKDKKILVYLVFNLILLIMTNYFGITQKDYMFEHFPKQAYGMLLLLLLMYINFFRSVYSLIKIKKSERPMAGK